MSQRGAGENGESGRALANVAEPWQKQAQGVSENSGKEGEGWKNCERFLPKAVYRTERMCYNECESEVEGMRQRTVCFTGHRNIEREHMLALPALLKAEIARQAEKGAVHFRAGGAIGFDTLAALCVLEQKKKYPHIQLDLILPCRDQDAEWNESNRQAYRFVLQSADSVSYVRERYCEGCMLERDRRLVEGSDACIAFLTKSRGGTAYTAAYALKSGLEFVNLFDEM